MKKWVHVCACTQWDVLPVSGCLHFVWFACMHTACVLTQVAKEFHSQCCEDEEEQHEEEAQVAHLQRVTSKPVSHLECLHALVLSI